MSNLDLTGMDVRVIEFHLRNGRITEADYKKYLATLDDSSEHGVETETTFSTPFAQRVENEGDDAAAEA